MIILGRSGLINQFLSCASGSQVQLAAALNRMGVLIGMPRFWESR